MIFPCKTGGEDQNLYPLRAPQMKVHSAMEHGRTGGGMGAGLTAQMCLKASHDRVR